jgi:hypothetical protein
LATGVMRAGARGAAVIDDDWTSAPLTSTATDAAPLVGRDGLELGVEGVDGGDVHGAPPVTVAPVQ